MIFKYPNTRREEVFDNYHGTKVQDPYRWMEKESDELKKWITEQNQITESYISKCKFRDAIKKTLQDVYDYDKVGCPAIHGKKYYFYKKSGLQQQYVLYVKDDLKSEERVFIDPNKFSKDGTVSMGATAFSKKGDYFAYGLSDSGSDWQRICVRHVNSGKDLSDVCHWVKFSHIDWTHDGKGFFYSRYPVPKTLKQEQDSTKLGQETDKLENQMLYYHVLGEPQEKDELIYSDPDHPHWMYSGEVSHDGKYLVTSISESTANVNRLYIVPLENKKKTSNGVEVIKLIDNFDAEYTYITNEDTVFYFVTNLKAKNKRIIAIDITKPQQENWKEIVPEKKDPLDEAKCANGKYMVLMYMHNVHDVLQIYDLQGKFIKELELPAPGQIWKLSADKDEKEVFFSFTSFTYPGSVFRYDFETNEITVFYETKIEKAKFDLKNFETKQIWYKSKDGTQIPMFIVTKKDIKLDGNNPCMLYGYGGFNISLKPSFNALRLAFVHHFNGVYAVPNIRGGGEFGEAWHEGGILDKKQNCFDDFAAAADYLIQNKYTNPKKLFISGGSNGGLLVAACANQFPDKFGAVECNVGVLDMLRYHKFTIGAAWATDYGTSDKEESFKYLIKYSPYHNVKPKTKYPAILVLTADHDDRVVPLHSFKYTAQLQHVAGSVEQQNPLMIRVEVKSGHGAGKPTTKYIEEVADIYSFVANALNIEFHE